MAEDPFVEEALQAARETLREPLLIRRGAALLYEVTVNNELELTINPKKPRAINATKAPRSRIGIRMA